MRLVRAARCADHDRGRLQEFRLHVLDRAVRAAKTPREIVDKLAQETEKALAAPGVREKLAQQGLDPMPITPAAFDAQIRREIGAVLALAKAANLKFN